MRVGQDRLLAGRRYRDRMKPFFLRSLNFVLDLLVKP